MNAPLERLASKILAEGVGADEAINPFWRAQLEAFRQTLARDGRLTSDGLFALGYCEADLPEGKSNRDLKSWKWRSRAFRQADPEGLDRTEVEHVGALAVLHRHGLIDEYLMDIDRLRLESSMSLARHWFYLRRLRQVQGKPGRILEVGAGGGHFARLAIDAGLALHYVIVDLPEMLLNSGMTLSAKTPAQLHLGEAPDFGAAGVHAWLLAPADRGLIPDRSIDVAVNFNSFMEMDDGVRDEYLAQVYRTARAGAVFYNVNRLQRTMTRSDGSTFEGNPLLYPYRATDRVIAWEPDEMQQTIRSRNFHPPQSWAISRIALIGA